MLLRRIEIENFRGLRSAVVDLDETTALIGENSAGKTTLLDAVAICCSGRDDTVTLEVRDFRQEGQAPPSETLGIALTFEGTDAEWAEQVARAVSPVPPPGLARAAGRSGSRSPARVVRIATTVEARWTFAGARRACHRARSRGCSPSGGGSRRCSGCARTATWSRTRGAQPRPRRPAAQTSPHATDPVARQLEQQIRLIYDRLTGASDIQDDELRRGLDAADAYLAARGPFRRAPIWPAPPSMSDLAETPVPSVRRDRAADLEHQAGPRHPRAGVPRVDRRHPRGERAPFAPRGGAAAAGARGRRGAPAPDDPVGDVGTHLEAPGPEDPDDELGRAAGGGPAAVDSPHRDRPFRDAGVPHRLRPVLGGRPAPDCLSRPNQQGERAVRAVLAVRRRGDRGVAAAGAGADSRLRLPVGGDSLRGVRAERASRAAAAGQRPRDRVAPAGRRRRGGAQLRHVGAGAT